MNHLADRLIRATTMRVVIIWASINGGIRAEYTIARPAIYPYTFHDDGKGVTLYFSGVCSDTDGRTGFWQQVVEIPRA